MTHPIANAFAQIAAAVEQEHANVAALYNSRCVCKACMVKIPTAILAKVELRGLRPCHLCGRVKIRQHIDFELVENSEDVERAHQIARSSRTRMYSAGRR